MSSAPTYPCPCCRYLTLAAPPPGTFAICPVCLWEDDRFQFANPDLAGGANVVSLAEARANFAVVGACEARFARFTRPPTPRERAGLPRR